MRSGIVDINSRVFYILKNKARQELEEAIKPWEKSINKMKKEINEEISKIIEMERYIDKS